MKTLYANDKLRRQCTDLKYAKKLFRGDESLAISLLARIGALEQASVLKDIIVTRPFRFHNLVGDRKGTFAIDVRKKHDKWRIILCPLDENKNKFNPCNVDEIATIVRIVEIREVSAHYDD